MRRRVENLLDFYVLDVWLLDWNCFGRCHLRCVSIGQIHVSVDVAANTVPQKRLNRPTQVITILQYTYTPIVITLLCIIYGVETYHIFRHN